MCVVWVGAERWSKNNLFWGKEKSKLLMGMVMPWPVWPSPAKQKVTSSVASWAHAWVVEWVPVGVHTRGNPSNVSLSEVNVSFPFFSLSLKKKSLKLIRSVILGNEVMKSSFAYLFFKNPSVKV